MTPQHIVCRVQAEITQELRDYIDPELLDVVLARVAAIPFVELDSYLAVMQEVVRASLQPLVDRVRFEKLETSPTVQ